MRANYDFSKAKRARDVPHLQQLRAEKPVKTRISIMLDDDVLAAFREQADRKGAAYQTEINRILREYLGGGLLTLEAVRKVVREELHAA